MKSHCFVIADNWVEGGDGGPPWEEAKKMSFQS